MGPFGSTLSSYPVGRKTVPRQLAVRIVGRDFRARAPEELVALLFPMVRRAVRTERGPAALVRWLRQSTGAPRAGHQAEQAARRLTEDLVRVLFDPPGAPGDTLRDALA